MYLVKLPPACGFASDSLPRRESEANPQAGGGAREHYCHSSPSVQKEKFVRHQQSLDVRLPRRQCRSPIALSSFLRKSFYGPTTEGDLGGRGFAREDQAIERLDTSGGLTSGDCGTMYQTMDAIEHQRPIHQIEGLRSNR